MFNEVFFIGFVAPHPWLFARKKWLNLTSSETSAGKDFLTLWHGKFGFSHYSTGLREVEFTWLKPIFQSGTPKVAFRNFHLAVALGVKNLVVFVTLY
jgi:hypothetical protein